MTAAIFILCLMIAYLAGSVCSAVIVSQLFALPDPRTGGSKNPGATNVLRLAGKKYAAIVFLADMLKGLLPVLLAKWLSGSLITASFTCFAAVLGHMYPVFFQFRGGKGVATAIGALLGLNLFLGVVVIVVWFILVNLTGYVSVASILALVFAPFYSLFSFGNLNAFLPLCFISIFVLYKHRQNIARLIDGQEPKVNLRRKIAQSIAEEEKQHPETKDEPHPIEAITEAIIQQSEKDKDKDGD